MYWRPFLHFAWKGIENRQQNSESRHVTTDVRHQPPHGTKLLGGSVGATLGPDTSEKRKNPFCSSLSPQASHPYYTQISYSRREKKTGQPSIHPFQKTNWPVVFTEKIAASCKNREKRKINCGSELQSL
jgi:hypothetical protein